MDVEFPPNSLHLTYLEPLRKWKILDLKGLLDKSSYPSSYKSFSKLILKLEKKGLVGSLYDPFTAKKYVFLDEKGNQYIGVKDHTKFPINTFVHDSKVIDLIQWFMKLDFCDDFKLSYELTSFHVPDAILIRFVDENWPTTKMAFELELTQKSIGRFLDKMRWYVETSYYETVIYYFQNKNVLLTYKREFKKTYGEKYLGKFLFLLNEQLFSKNYDFDKTLFHTKSGWKEIKGRLKTVSEEKIKCEKRKEKAARPERWWSSALTDLF